MKYNIYTIISSGKWFAALSRVKQPVKGATRIAFEIFCKIYVFVPVSTPALSFDIHPSAISFIMPSDNTGKDIVRQFHSIPGRALDSEDPTIAQMSKQYRISRLSLSPARGSHLALLFFPSGIPPRNSRCCRFLSA
jgi:hypothetical protein